MASLRQHAVALALVAAFASTSLYARAHNELSEASAISALPVAVSLAAPAMLLVGGAALTVVSVQASATGTVWVTGGQVIVTNNTCNTIIGNSGIGQLTVSNATLLHRQILMAANGGQGTLTIAGGTNTLSGTLSIANFAFTKSSVWLRAQP